MAIEEALLAENGILNKSFGTGEISNAEAYSYETQEPTTSNQGQEYYTQGQVMVLSISSILRAYLFHSIEFSILVY